MHEGRFRPSEMAGKDTRHPHRGFDNLWYVLQGSGTLDRAGTASRRVRCSGSGRARARGTPRPVVLHRDRIPVHRQGDATLRVLVGEGSPVRLGTPALILDVELPDGGQLVTPVPPEFQGFAYLLDGEAVLGANKRKARPPQLVLLGPDGELTVTDATPGTRFMLMAGKPYREAPLFNGRLWTRAAGPSSACWCGPGGWSVRW